MTSLTLVRRIKARPQVAVSYTHLGYLARLSIKEA